MSVITDQFVSGVEIKGKSLKGFREILTPEAILFITKLHLHFNSTRLELLHRREEKQLDIDAGTLPDFSEATRNIREDNWTVAPLPSDLIDRRIEIIASPDRSAILNALNSGANIFIADFEDSTSPTWDNVISGQMNLRDAINGTITYLNPANGKFYLLTENDTTLMVCPRSWHSDEKHFLLDGEPISASLFDFGLFFFHNAKKLIEKGSGPYFYLPKLENHMEARLWNDIFIYAQKELDIPVGTVKAAVFIENLIAAFEMDEILYELKEHSAGLSCGSCNYVSSFINKFRRHPHFVLPDQSQITMVSECMNSLSLLMIKTCHQRNAHAIGGVYAFVPVKDNQEVNEIALTGVKTEMEREVLNGYDGIRIAHPGLIKAAKEIFDKYLPEPNQFYNKMEEIRITQDDLLALPIGTITIEGLRANINIGIRYLEECLNGNGSVLLDNRMGNAATAEISKSQVWQWLHKPGAMLEDGTQITIELYKNLLKEELDKIKKSVAESKRNNGFYEHAADLFDKLVMEKEFLNFTKVLACNYL
jgi:malate synthase